MQRIRRGKELLSAEPETVLQAGDVLAVSGRREVLVNLLGEKAVEVDDRELLDIPVASYDVFVSSKEFAGPDEARVFDAFYQVDASSTRAYGGSGIGRALLSQLLLNQ